MNFAFPALVILVLSLPGIFFRFGYKNGIDTHIKGDQSLGDISLEIAKGVLIAIAIHLSACYLLTLASYPPTSGLNGVFYLLAGSNNDASLHKALENISQPSNYMHVSLYVLTTSCVGLLLGMLFRRIIKSLFLDVRFPVFRMENQWEYFFNGGDHAKSLVESAKIKWKYFALYKILRQEVTCYVSLLVETPKESSLLVGILADYDFNADGKLETITLEEVSRMDLPTTEVDVISIIFPDSDQPKNDALRHAKIHGHFFVVPYSTIKTINAEFTYRDSETDFAVGENGKRDSQSRIGKFFCWMSFLGFCDGDVCGKQPPSNDEK